MYCWRSSGEAVSHCREFWVNEISVEGVSPDLKIVPNVFFHYAHGDSGFGLCNRKSQSG